MKGTTTNGTAVGLLIGLDPAPLLERMTERKAVDLRTTLAGIGGKKSNAALFEGRGVPNRRTELEGRIVEIGTKMGGGAMDELALEGDTELPMVDGVATRTRFARCRGDVALAEGLGTRRPMREPVRRVA